MCQKRQILLPSSDPISPLVPQYQLPSCDTSTILRVADNAAPPDEILNLLPAPHFSNVVGGRITSSSADVPRTDQVYNERMHARYKHSGPPLPVNRVILSDSPTYADMERREYELHNHGTTHGSGAYSYNGMSTNNKEGGLMEPAASATPRSAYSVTQNAAVAMVTPRGGLRTVAGAPTSAIPAPVYQHVPNIASAGYQQGTSVLMRCPGINVFMT